VNYNRGCSPLKVVINETDTFPDDVVIQYDFEGDGDFVGFEPAEEISFTYVSPGIHTIVQLVGLDNVPKTDSIELEIFEPTIPDFQVLTCEGQAATLIIQPDQYEQYLIYFTSSDSVLISKGDPVPQFTYSAGTYQIDVKGLYIDAKNNCGTGSETFQTINNLSAGQIDNVFLSTFDQSTGTVDIDMTMTPDVVYQMDMAVDFPAGFDPVDLVQYPESSFHSENLNTEENIYFFRLSAYDACQGKHLYSDTLSTIILTTKAENSRNRLDWEVNALKFQSYEISRNGETLSTRDDENVKFLIDLDVDCGQEYCYSIVFQNSNGASSYSNEVCVTAFSIYFPPAIRNTSASVDGEQVHLSWKTPVGINEAQKYFIQLLTGDEVYSTIDTTLNTYYVHDTEDIIDKQICYRINYVDECNNRSNLGALACTMFLSNDEEDLLEWTPYAGWNSGVMEYVIQSLNEDGELQRQHHVGNNTSYTDPDYYKKQVEVYRVLSMPIDPEMDSVYSNTFLKILDSKLNIPTAFTPNGDGLNDVFLTSGTDMMKFSLRIYMRDGLLIFETEDQSKGWDGSYKGKDLPFGSYIFEVQATDYYDKEFKENGTIVLIK